MRRGNGGTGGRKAFLVGSPFQVASKGKTHAKQREFSGKKVAEGERSVGSRERG